MRIGIVQLEVIDGQPALNGERFTRAIETNPGADLYLLPELWSTGYAHDAWAAAADRETPLIVERLRSMSREGGFAVGGSLVSRDEAGCLVNRFWLIDGDAVPHTYDKVHLFEPLREHEFLARGSRAGEMRLRGEPVSATICFDLRFPEVYRAQAVGGIRLFLVVAEWPEPRQAILLTLARARAMENQAFIALCNRIGPAFDGLRFPGCSAVFGPDGGERLAPCTGTGVFFADIDLQDADRMRERLPVLTKRVAGIDFG